MTIRLGTRGSRLAATQTRAVAEQLSRLTGSEVELVIVSTDGDTSAAPLASFGGRGVFVNALRDALLSGQCDAIVHSLKDLPTADYPGLVLAAIPRRADARDVLCAADGSTLESLPTGARVG